jgi:hypothetical protein
MSGFGSRAVRPAAVQSSSYDWSSKANTGSIDLACQIGVGQQAPAFPALLLRTPALASWLDPALRHRWVLRERLFDGRDAPGRKDADVERNYALVRSRTSTPDKSFSIDLEAHRLTLQLLQVGAMPGNWGDGNSHTGNSRRTSFASVGIDAEGEKDPSQMLAIDPEHLKAGYFSAHLRNRAVGCSLPM